MLRGVSFAFRGGPLSLKWRCPLKPAWFHHPCPRAATPARCVWPQADLTLLTVCARQRYCYVCCDGDDELLLCDLCTRVVCRKHLQGLPTAFNIAPYRFICMACHGNQHGKSPYRVSPSVSALKERPSSHRNLRLFMSRFPVRRIRRLGLPPSPSPSCSMCTTPFPSILTCRALRH